MLLLLLQLACYINQYYVVVYLLGPIPFWAILILTFANSRALLALYVSNSTHQKTFPKSVNSQFCKKCSDWITHRDHHCVFTGRCVEKNNYAYFISYVLYSYILSTVLVASILCNYPLLVNIMDIEFKVFLRRDSLASLWSLDSSVGCSSWCSQQDCLRPPSGR
jgi:hypothetical protein